MMNPSSSATIPGSLKEQAGITKKIAVFRQHGYSDDLIRQYLIKEDGLLPDDVMRIVPPAPPMAGAAADVSQALPTGAPPVNDPFGAKDLAQQFGEHPLKTAAGYGLEAAKGYTLGLTDLVPGLKQFSQEFEQRNPGTAMATQFASGVKAPLGPVLGGAAHLAEMANLQRVARLARGLQEIAAPTSAAMGPATPAGIGDQLKRLAAPGIQNAKTGALYGGIYGLNTGGLPGAIEGTIGGGLMGGAIGTFLTPVERSIRARNLGPDDYHPVAVQKIQDAIRQDLGQLPSPEAAKALEAIPGHSLIDVGGSNTLGLANQAFNSSPLARVAGDTFRKQRIDALHGVLATEAHNIAGLSPVATKGNLNPLVVANKLDELSKMQAAPFYKKLDQNNTVLPMTPGLENVLNAPVIKKLTTEFSSFAKNEQAAERARAQLGWQARGDLGPAAVLPAALPKELQPLTTVPALLKSSPPEIQAQFLATENASRQAKAAVYQQAQAQQVSGGSWRRLDILKRMIDDKLSSEAGRTMGKQEQAQLRALRAQLIEELDQGVGKDYAEARAAFAGPQVHKEMLEQGMKDASRGADYVEATLTDPNIQKLGPDALAHYKLGVLSQFRTELGHRAKGMDPGQFFVPDRIKTLKLIAKDPQLAANLDALVPALEQQHGSLSAYPARIAQPQDVGGEVKGLVESGLAATAIGQPRLAGRNVANYVRQIASRRLPPRIAEDVVRLLNSNKIGDAITLLNTKTSSKLPLLSKAAGVGTGITTDYLNNQP